ncbi:MAG: hypothetical protein WA667_16420 [Candidatus Nitrosopolaris sp.]
MVSMYNQYNKNKIDGLGTRPELKQGTHFYVPMDVIFVELKDCSNYATGIESSDSSIIGLDFNNRISIHIILTALEGDNQKLSVQTVPENNFGWLFS